MLLTLNAVIVCILFLLAPGGFSWFKDASRLSRSFTVGSAMMGSLLYTLGWRPDVDYSLQLPHPVYYRLLMSLTVSKRERFCASYYASVAMWCQLSTRLRLVWLWYCESASTSILLTHSRVKEQRVYILSWYWRSWRSYRGYPGLRSDNVASKENSYPIHRARPVVW